jgi:hypothetical protein
MQSVGQLHALVFPEEKYQQKDDFIIRLCAVSAGTPAWVTQDGGSHL